MGFEREKAAQPDARRPPRPRYGHGVPATASDPDHIFSRQLHQSMKISKELLSIG